MAQPIGVYDPRFLIIEPDAAYRKRAASHLTSHALGDYRKCPLLHRKKALGLIPDTDTAAYLVGRAAHTLILEGQVRFEADFAVGGPINPKTGNPYGRNTNAWAEWAARVSKDVLTDDQYALATNMASSINTHPFAVELLAHGVPEGVVRTTYCNRPCQGRIDWFSPVHGVTDVKTCDDLTWFESDARRFGYAFQMAFYQALVEVAIGRKVPVHMIAVEKREPFRCGVWCIAQTSLDTARSENEAAMGRLKACELTGVWPTGYEQCRVFDSV